MGKQNTELNTFADLLIKSLVKLFMERGEIDFTNEPAPARRNITEYQGKMRADGMEKFDNEPTYVSAVNFYASEKDMKKQNTLGALVIYVQQEYIAKLLRLLQYPPVDDESEEAMLDSCGTLCNIVSGAFKSAISAAGYIELEMSHFMNYRNSAFLGVDFCFQEYDLVEIECHIHGEKRLIVEMTMGVVPKR